MKHFVLAAICAKYTHSSLALRYLARFAENDTRHKLETREFTINQRADFILEELFCSAPDVLCISCYIWNIELVKQLCPEIKKILPRCTIVLGGPEVSYDCEAFLQSNPAVDIIIRGEGELTFTELLDCLETENPQLYAVNGITFTDGKNVITTPPRAPLDLALLPFPYEEGFAELEDKAIYYESSRGCPYRCAYCLSSVEKGVRFVPLPQVFAALQRFLDAGVRRVKFVDRTFNCNREHTMAVWNYLAAHDNGVTNFHFELTADLLDDEMIESLRPLRKGLFQFEIGVQSTNGQTIDAINRRVDFTRLSQIVRKVKALGNIHQHLDLIAGLPCEDYASFGKSFDDVYALEPEQLQLGFLKLLKGSPMHGRCAEYGMTYRSYAPYEVLETSWIPHRDLLRLHHIEEMVESFYNSGKFLHTMAYFVTLFPSPFACYEGLGKFWVQGQHHCKSHNKTELCDILYAFACTQPGLDAVKFRWLLKLDLCLHEKPKKLPSWLVEDNNAEYRAAILSFYAQEENLSRYLPQYQNLDCRAIYRVAHIEVFGSDPAARRTLLFNYDCRDLLGNALPYEITL